MWLLPIFVCLLVHIPSAAGSQLPRKPLSEIEFSEITVSLSEDNEDSNTITALPERDIPTQLSRDLKNIYADLLRLPATSQQLFIQKLGLHVLRISYGAGDAAIYTESKPEYNKLTYYFQEISTLSLQCNDVVIMVLKDLFNNNDGTSSYKNTISPATNAVQNVTNGTQHLRRLICTMMNDTPDSPSTHVRLVNTSLPTRSIYEAQQALLCFSNAYAALQKLYEDEYFAKDFTYISIS